MIRDYNPLINTYELQWMNDCVHEVIHSWHDHIIAYIPLPKDKQDNYDRAMREFTGAIKFYKKIIRAERVELQQSYHDSVPPKDIDYGRRDDGELIYAIPDDIPIFDDMLNVHGFENWKPDIFTIFDIDDGSGEKYYVRTVKERVGQRLLMLYRYDGTTPNGINDRDIIVYEDEDSMDFDARCPIFTHEYDDDKINIKAKGVLYERHDETENMGVSLSDNGTSAISDGTVVENFNIRYGDFDG